MTNPFGTPLDVRSQLVGKTYKNRKVLVAFDVLNNAGFAVQIDPDQPTQLILVSYPEALQLVDSNG